MKSVLKRTVDGKTLCSSYTGTEAFGSSKLTSGSSWTAIINLAWPMMLNMMVLSVANCFEGWIAGQLGAISQSAVGIVSQVWFFVILLTLALSAGTMSILSRCYGAGNRQATIDGARQSLLLAVIFGALITVGSYICGRPLLFFFGASPAVANEAWTYLAFASLSALPSTVLWISSSIFRAIGDSRTPLSTIAIISIVMIVLDYIFCLKPFGMGVAGIGLSWLVSSLLGIVINIFALKRSVIADCLDLNALRRLQVSTAWLKEYLSLGLPACMQDISIVLSSFGLFYILSNLTQPVLSQAVWAAGWRLEETFTIMPMYGLNMAAATIVGQNVGAGQFGRAKTCGWQILSLAVLISTLGAVFLWCFADRIASVMTSDTPVVIQCADYIKMLSWTQPFLAAWLVLSRAMQGLGSMTRPMFVTIGSFDFIRLALAWYLSSLFGAEGVWIGMAVSTVVAALWMVRVWKTVEPERAARIIDSASDNPIFRNGKIPANEL